MRRDVNAVEWITASGSKNRTYGLWPWCTGVVFASIFLGGGREGATIFDKTNGNGFD